MYPFIALNVTPFSLCQVQRLLLQGVAWSSHSLIAMLVHCRFSDCTTLVILYAELRLTAVRDTIYPIMQRN
jgi:hypothetical protein